TALGARMPEGARVFDRTRLTRMFVVNRDILIRTALLIVAWTFFATHRARAPATSCWRRIRCCTILCSSARSFSTASPRRLRLGGRAAVRPRDRRARRTCVLARGQAFALVGIRVRRRCDPDADRGGAVADRPDDCEY